MNDLVFIVGLSGIFIGMWTGVQAELKLAQPHVWKKS